MTDDRRHGLRLLSIDGGGIRGMSSLVILRRLMHRLQMRMNRPIMQLPCDCFDMMDGTGTGGVIVLMLGRLRMSVDETIKAFEQLSKDVFVDGAGIGGDSLFKASKLEEAINQIVLSKTGHTETALMDEAASVCKTFVSAMNTVNMNANIPMLFRTYNSPEEEPTGCTVSQAARATSAACALFEPTKIGSQCYIGGDLGKNNPAALLLSEAASVFPDRDVACIVSIGTGKCETISMDGPWRSLGDAAKVVQLIANDCESTHEALSQHFRDTPQLYFRFNVEQGSQGISTTQYERMAEVEAHTKQYIAEEAVKARLGRTVKAMKEQPCVAPTTALAGIRVAPVAPELQSAMKSLQAFIQDVEQRKHAFEWLAAPPDPNPFKKGRQHHQNTGSWLLDSDIFKNWTTNERSSMWIYGKPGSGKTVICSTVIDSISKLCRAKKWGFAAYYCDFREERTLSDFLSSLLQQISRSPFSNPWPLVELYSSHQSGISKASNEELTTAVMEALAAFEHTYVIVDALDESGIERCEVLHWMSTFVKAIPPSVHILMTSRRESDIIEYLERHVSQCMDMANPEADSDIRAFIRAKLNQDHLLARRWTVELRNEIEATLTVGAKGMFRWVVCQLDALCKCLNERDIRHTLESLPRTLDETYDRLLQQIDELHIDRAHKLLSWLCFSTRRLSVAEAAEAVAIDVSDGGSPFLNVSTRLLDPSNVLTILSSLLVISHQQDPSYLWRSDQTGPFVELAHYSVKEYLLSQRAAISCFRLLATSAHAMIGKSCLAYMRHWPEVLVIGTEPWDLYTLHHRLDTLDGDYPLMQYAVQAWPDHIWPPGCDGSGRLYAEVMKSISSPTFCVLFSLRYLATHQHGSDVGWRHPSAASPLYSPVFCEVQPLHRPVVNLLASSTLELHRVQENPPWKVHFYLIRHPNLDRRWKTAISASRLLEVKNRENKAALHLASDLGHETAVRMLLDAGTDVNRGDQSSKTALHLASGRRHEAVVLMLLDAGADVNGEDGFSQTALHLACGGGHEVVVRMLLDAGANVNGQALSGRTALHLASGNGHEAVARMLLDAGANVNGKDANASANAFSRDRYPPSSGVLESARAPRGCSGASIGPSSQLIGHNSCRNLDL